MSSHSMYFEHRHNKVRDSNNDLIQCINFPRRVGLGNREYEHLSLSLQWF